MSKNIGLTKESIIEMVNKIEKAVNNSGIEAKITEVNVGEKTSKFVLTVNNEVKEKEISKETDDIFKLIDTMYDDLEEDPLYDEVVKFVTDIRKASASILQRKFKIGYNRASRLMDKLEEDGIIGPSQGSKPREVLK